MASNKTRGSGVTSSRSTMAQRVVVQQAPQPAPQISVQQLQPNQVTPTAQQAQTANNGQFSDHDSADYHDLYNGRGYFQKQSFGIDSELARQNYLASNPEGTQYGGDGVHSLSQNMNWELMNNLPLSPTHQATADGLDEAMHNLGYNLNLQRYDHGSFVDRLLQQFGVHGRTTGMTESQLQKALVGRSFSENKFLSTSYNNFKNAIDPSTFTTREVKIEYRAKASVQAFMPGDGPGGRLGEIIGARNIPQKIVGLSVSPVANARAEGTPPGSRNRKQITIVIELG